MMITYKILIIVILVCASFLSQADDTCLDWMISSGVYPGVENCESQCSVIPMGMGNFTCSSSCEALCKTDYLPKALNKSALGTIGYTADEILIAIKNPMDMQKAKKLSEIVTKRTLSIFRFNGRNDESDAFRHFLWAGLMTEKIGASSAVKILNAHENNPDQAREEKEMDVSNNTVGIKAAKRLLKENKFSRENLEKKALELLKSKKLKINKSSGDLPKWRK